MIRSALWFPLFDELADPRAVADLAVEAEAAGWHGLFVWDGSIIPVPLGVNPLLTISALAEMVVPHLHVRLHRYHRRLRSGRLQYRGD